LRPPEGHRIRKLLRGELPSPRLFDVTSDQIRGLRSRMLVRDFESTVVRGALIKMGKSVRDIDIQIARRRELPEYDHFLSDEESRLALTHPTDLKALPKHLFDRIARHGFEAAGATLAARAPERFARFIGWPSS